MRNVTLISLLSINSLYHSPFITKSPNSMKSILTICNSRFIKQFSNIYRSEKAKESLNLLKSDFKQTLQPVIHISQSEFEDDLDEGSSFQTENIKPVSYTHLTLPTTERV